MKEYIITFEDDDWFLEYANERYPHFFGCPIKEIVRCRDCRYFNCLWVDCYVCKRNGEKFMPFVELDGYCAWGERRNP